MHELHERVYPYMYIYTYDRGGLRLTTQPRIRKATVEPTSVLARKGLQPSSTVDTSTQFGLVFYFEDRRKRKFNLANKVEFRRAQHVSSD